MEERAYDREDAANDAMRINNLSPESWKALDVETRLSLMLDATMRIARGRLT